jgi:hypothetical protein
MHAKRRRAKNGPIIYSGHENVNRTRSLVEAAGLALVFDAHYRIGISLSSGKSRW